MQVFLPPEGLTNFGEASPTQDNGFCAQLQRFQIKSMNERGLHSWHAENCSKKFPFLCKRSMCSRCLLHQKSRARVLSCNAYFGKCLFPLRPDRTNVCGHKRQRCDRGVLLHPQGGRPVSELHVSWRRARDVRGCVVRPSAGLPALPQGPQRVLQVHLPGPRYCLVTRMQTSYWVFIGASLSSLREHLIHRSMRQSFRLFTLYTACAKEIQHVIFKLHFKFS